MEDALGIASEIVFSGITVMFAVGAICCAADRPADRPHRRAHHHGGGLGGLRAVARGTRLLAGPRDLSAVLGGRSASPRPWRSARRPASRSPRSPGRARGGRSACWPSSAASPRRCSGRCRARSTWPSAGAARCWSMPPSTCSPARPSICWCCRAGRRPIISPRRPRPRHAGVPTEIRSRVFLLLSLTLSSGAFVFTGAMVHMIEILRGLGHPAASAVLLASLIGPAQVTHPPVRAAVRPPLLDHELRRVRLGDAAVRAGAGAAGRRQLRRGAGLHRSLRHVQRAEGGAARHPAARPVRPRPVRRLHGPSRPAAGHRLGRRAAGRWPRC